MFFDHILLKFTPLVTINLHINFAMPENIKQTFIFDVRFLHTEQNGSKFESKHQIYYYEQKWNKI